VNQVVQTALLAAMPTQDDVDITPVQKGDQSHGVVIPGAGGPPGDRGGVRASNGPTSGQGGIPTGDRGSGPTGDSGLALAPSKGKQVHVVLDDDEVSSDEDEPLQKWLRRLSSTGPSGPASAAPDEAAATTAVANKEVTVKRVTEEATERRAAEESAVKRAAEEAAVKAAADEEAVMKAAADEEVTEKTADRAIVQEAAAGATRDSPAPG
jgi:hypothetical protein